MNKDKHSKKIHSSQANKKTNTISPHYSSSESESKSMSRSRSSYSSSNSDKSRSSSYSSRSENDDYELSSKQYLSTKTRIQNKKSINIDCENNKHLTSKKSEIQSSIKLDNTEIKHSGKILPGRQVSNFSLKRAAAESNKE